MGNNCPHTLYTLQARSLGPPSDLKKIDILLCKNLFETQSSVVLITVILYIVYTLLIFVYVRRQMGYKGKYRVCSYSEISDCMGCYGEEDQETYSKLKASIISITKKSRKF